MASDKNYQELLERVDRVTNQKKLDVNSEEDLVVGIMNLIGIEEHLFFTAEKTGKDVYLKLLNEVRKMRVELLKTIIKEYEGEVWCTSKHLLAASMRMMEVGTKYLKEGRDKEAKEYFERAYNLYNLFFALNMKMVDTKTLKEKGLVSAEDIKKIGKEDGIQVAVSENSKSASTAVDKSFFSKIGDAVKKAIDCCRE